MSNTIACTDIRYVQVNIGRNTQLGPMLNQEWKEFIDDTVDALTDFILGDSAVSGIEIHHGTGHWDNRAEKSAHISVVADVDVATLRIKLERIKRSWRQDSIAIIQRSELI